MLNAYCHKNIFEPDVKRYFDKNSSCCLKPVLPLQRAAKECAE